MFIFLTPGQNSHLLLSNLVKHLDNKNVAKEPLTQIEILNVTSHLAEIAKEQSSVAITGAISDLVKHLRKCIQLSSEVSSPRGCPDKYYIDLQSALEKCISQLSIKVCLIMINFIAVKWIIFGSRCLYELLSVITSKGNLIFMSSLCGLLFVT